MKNFLLVLKSGLPQVFGILSFISVINLLDNKVIGLSLPAYQAGLSFASIFFLGIAYLNKRAAISLCSYYLMVTSAALIFFIISFGFKFPNLKEASSLLIFFILSLIGYIQFFVLGKFGIKGLLNANIVISILAPVILALNSWGLGAVLLLINVLLYYLLKINQCEVANESKFGHGFLRSILVQLPFLAFPFFDVLLISFAGVDKYITFSLSFKIANGMILFLFSYLQQSVLGGDYKYIRYISWNFYLLLLLAFLLSTNSPEWLMIPIQCALISIAINLSSLNLRSCLKIGSIGNIDVFISIFMIFIYYLYLIDGVSWGVSNNGFMDVLFLISLIVGLRSYINLRKIYS